MALSVSDGSGKGQHYVLGCDDCGQERVEFSTALDIRDQTAALGWTRVPRDLCPACFAVARHAVMSRTPAPAPSARGADAAA